jgi:hypothetical protein
MTGFAIASALSALTVVLLAVLVVTWGRTYLDFRTPLVLGLVLFSLFLLVENSVALYFYFVAEEMYYVDDPAIGNLIAVLRGLQLLAVGAFTYVSLR